MLAVCLGPSCSGTQIRQISVHQLKVRPKMIVAEVVFPPLCASDEMVGVPLLRLVAFASPCKALVGVFPDRLEEPIAGFAVGISTSTNQAFGEERSDEVERVDVESPPEGFGGVETEATDENTEASKQS